MKNASPPEASIPPNPSPWWTKPGKSLYHLAEPLAHLLKVILQMSVGVWAVVELIRLSSVALRFPKCPMVQPGVTGFCYRLPKGRPVLELIGAALVVAAAIELAYTLFTEGPDEALNPLMLGVASAALLQLGNSDGLDVKQGLALLCYALALAVLFAVRLFLATDLDADLDKEGATSLPWWARSRWAARHSTSQQRPPLTS